MTRPDVGGEYGPYVQETSEGYVQALYRTALVKGQGLLLLLYQREGWTPSTRSRASAANGDRRDLPQEEVDRLLASGVPYIRRKCRWRALPPSRTRLEITGGK